MATKIELQKKIENLMEILSERWEKELWSKNGYKLYVKNEDNDYNYLEEWKFTENCGHTEKIINRKGDIITIKDWKNRWKNNYRKKNKGLKLKD